MNTFTLLMCLILTINYLPSINCTHDNNLVVQTCHRTPLPGLCTSILSSDPRSAKADVPRLGLIVLDKLEAKAKKTIQHIKALQGVSHPAEVKKALTTCAEVYNAVVVGDVPQAKEALSLGDYKFAENGANDAVVEAQSCEGELKGKVPELSKSNKDMHDVSTVLAAIARQLL